MRVILILKLSELRVLLSGLCVKTVLPTVSNIFNAEFAEADAELAEKSLFVFHIKFLMLNPGLFFRKG